jgi:ribosome biogenesis GTPase A
MSKRNQLNRKDRGEPQARAAASWFPPHMHRAQRKLLETVRHADLVIEVRDARLPLGSANSELEQLGERRELARLIVFTKADLAEPKATLAWERYFRGRALPCLFLDSAKDANTRKVMQCAREMCLVSQQRYQRRAIRPPTPRVMVVGIPNVGKSTLINRLLHRKRLRVGPEPGVTRDALWVPVKGDIELMDTPGILLPRIETKIEAQRLAWIGAIPSHLLGSEDLATALLGLLYAESSDTAPRLYRLSAFTTETLGDIARSRGFLNPGAAPDLPRAAEQVLRDFREGLLGRVTFELPQTSSPAPAF